MHLSRVFKMFSIAFWNISRKKSPTTVPLPRLEERQATGPLSGGEGQHLQEAGVWLSPCIWQGTAVLAARAVNHCSQRPHELKAVRRM
jgi:hypothetical protein